MKFILSFILLTSFLLACSPASRNPASRPKLIKDTPVFSADVKLVTLEKGLQKAVELSPVLKTVNHFSMDPITKLLTVNLTVNYPLKNLLSNIPLESLPEHNLNDDHEIEMTISFPKTQSLSKTSYFGIQFHKFAINGDDYINAFSVVFGVVKTVLANSELVDFVMSQAKPQIKDLTGQEIVQDLLENNNIIVYHDSRKIKFKMNLEKISKIDDFASDYAQAKVWRFSPNYDERNDEITFKMVIGEGKPSDKWLTEEVAEIKDDASLLYQAREDLYIENSNLDNFMEVSESYITEVLNKSEVTNNLAKTNLKTALSNKRHQKKINEHIRYMQNDAKGKLTKNGRSFPDAFIADPVYEYGQALKHMRSRTRMFVSNLAQDLDNEALILSGGNKKHSDDPILTQLISQKIITNGINSLVDLEVENIQLIDEINFILIPGNGEMQLRGNINAPMEKLLSLQEVGVLKPGRTDVNLDVKLSELDEGIPFKLTISSKMYDYGKIGIGIKSLTLFPEDRKAKKDRRKELVIDRNSKNSQFLIDLTKMFIAKSVANLKIQIPTEVDIEAQKAEEMKQILEYISQFQKRYSKDADLKEFAKIFKSDIELNPYILAGQNHVLKKADILLDKLVEYNSSTNELEITVDPTVLLDEINKTKHGLQVWNIEPIHSRELDGNFLEVSIGYGQRSNSYVNKVRDRQNSVENVEDSNIYYELGEEKLPIDLLTSINFDYLEKYVNKFLSDMSKNNKINIRKQAKNDKSKFHFEPGNIKFDIQKRPGKDPIFYLEAQIKMAGYTRLQSLDFWNKKLKEDVVTFKAQLELTSKNIPINNSEMNLETLQFHSEAISVNPKQIRATLGSPTLLEKGLLGILNKTVRGGVTNDNLAKKFLMKMVNKFLKSMYVAKDGKLTGHEMEKSARIVTTDKDILIFLNPRMAGPAFELKLASEGQKASGALFKAIKLDAKKQMLHAGFTASFSMAKNDKKALVDIFKDTHILLEPYLTESSPEKFKKMMATNQLHGLLLDNGDKRKYGLYRKMIDIMKKYDQVLHTTNMKGASESMKTRISATGSELMYFAIISQYMQRKLKKLVVKMKENGLATKEMKRSSYYDKFNNALFVLEQDVTPQLIAQYSKVNHDINKTIVSSPISYWTYQFFPDAYFSEAAYKLILSK